MTDVCKGTYGGLTGIGPGIYWFEALSSTKEVHMPAFLITLPAMPKEQINTA